MEWQCSKYRLSFGRCGKSNSKISLKIMSYHLPTPCPKEVNTMDWVAVKEPKLSEHIVGA